MAFIVRIIEAIGNAAFLTASFAIIAKEFPDNVSITFASLETFFGLGLIVGPMVGGALYQLGGYFLPFVTLGMLLFLTAVITLCVLPHHNETLQQGHSTGKIKIFDKNDSRNLTVKKYSFFLLWFSFNTVLIEDSRDYGMCNEHNGNQCINWISWSNA